jgi:hypothetical protein
MALGGFQEIDGHRINQRKIPGGFAVGGRLKFCDAELRIGQPRNVTHIVGAQIVKRLERVVMNRRSSPESGLTTNCNVGVVCQTLTVLSQLIFN